MSDQKLKNDPDFIYAEDYGNSLKKLLKNSPNGVSDTKLMQSLKLSKEEMSLKMIQIREVFLDFLN